MKHIMLWTFFYCSFVSPLIPELQLFTKKLHDIKNLLPQESTEPKKITKKELDNEIEHEQEFIEERWKAVKEHLISKSNIPLPQIISGISFLPVIQTRMATLQDASETIRTAYIKSIYTVLEDIDTTLTKEQKELLRKNKDLFSDLLNDFKHLQPTEEPIIQKSLLLNLPGERLIGATTIKLITNNPPYTLQSGNVIMQVEVLNQFLYADAFQENNYYNQIATFQDYVPVYSRNQEYILQNIVKPYIMRLISYALDNKNLQNKLKLNPVENENIGGGAASCGYHALKNALYTIQAVRPTEKTTTKNFGDTLDITKANKLFGSSKINNLLFKENKPGEWRQYALDNKNGDTNGEWLNENGLKDLWGKIIKPRIQDFSDLTVYGSPKAAYETLFDEDILYREKNLNTLFKNKKEYIHTFILGGGNEAYQHEKNTPITKFAPSLHWVALIVNIVDNKVQYIILDSLNMPRYQEEGQLRYTHAPNYSDEKTRQLRKNDIIDYHINDMITMIETIRK